MAFTPLISIGSYAFPEPATYEAQTSDLVDSGRNVEGYVIGSVIRYDVAKISMTWRYLSVTDWAEILQKFKRSSGGNFYNSVHFFCQTTGKWEVRNMYVSDRKAGLMFRDKNGNLKGWLNCSLNLIEV